MAVRAANTCYSDGVVTVRQLLVDSRSGSETRSKRPRRSATRHSQKDLELCINSTDDIYKLKLLVGKNAIPHSPPVNSQHHSGRHLLTPTPQIFQEWDVAPPRLELFYNDVLLENHATLQDCGIPIQAVVHAKVSAVTSDAEDSFAFIDVNPPSAKKRETGFYGSALIS